MYAVRQLGRHALAQQRVFGGAGSASRRFLSDKKVLSEEEKAAENIFIKRLEKERADKLAAEAAKATASKVMPSSTETGLGSKPNEPATSNSYLGIAAAVVALGVGVWYWQSSSSQKEHKEPTK
eukprot:SM000044S15922  [mRNA]  locus=s44:76101:77196:- [translate_table: standard]